MSKRDQFLLISFLTLLSSVAFTVSAFWLFKNHTAELAAHVEAALASHVPSERSLELRSVLSNERVSSLADNMFWVSFIQATGAFLSLVLLVPTLIYTRRAARAAAAAADEARTANAATQAMITHSRDTAKVELRPYVALDSVAVEKAAGRCTIVMHFKNFGRSPALDFVVDVAWGLHKDLKSSEVPENDTHKSTKTKLMPEQIKKITIFEKTDLLLSTVKSGQANLLIKLKYSSSSPYYDNKDEATELKLYIDKALLERKTAGVMS